MRFLGAICALTMACGLSAAEPTSREWYQAIRENRLTAIKTLAQSKAAIQVRDSRGATPLMYAAMVGSVDVIKLLLDSGADVNAKNGLDVTALIYGALEPEKVKILVAAGADVNAVSKMGRTPLIVAAGRPGGNEAVRLLLAKGADPKAEDRGNTTALTEAARVNDLASIRALVAAGADINAGNALGFTPLMLAAGEKNTAAVKLLLEKGADPNRCYERENPVRNGLIALTNLTPLMMAPTTSPEIIQMLLDSGAKVNARDGRGMTALMFAVASDTPDLAIIRMLLKAGADLSIASNVQERAGDWAGKFNHPEVLKLLGAAPTTETKTNVIAAAAKPRLDAREAIARSVPLLQTNASEYFKQSACVGCHHQTLITLAVERAARNGIPVNETARKEVVQVLKGERISAREQLLQNIFISVDGLAYSMLEFDEAGYTADDLTDGLSAIIASQQEPGGTWGALPVLRPPIEHSPWVRTALAARALARYPLPARRAEFEERVARSRRWLAESKPEVPYEHSFQVLGLVWTGASRAEIDRAAAEVRRLQRPDGGWAQTERLPTDAYATAVAVFALRQAGVAAQDSGLRRGVDYLLQRQQPDGSWHVRSRAPKLQPYFQSGFPYDHDQWISAAATAWSVAALSETLAPAPSTLAAR